MNSFRPVLVHLLAGCLLIPASSRAYDAPDFDFKLFSSDGIFLEKSEEEGLLGALAALASNFPSHAKVDDDVREKAIAIALRIDPLHYSSRQAHLALSEGSSPDPTPYFDSVSTVSETLWSSATRLLETPVDPDEGKLSIYLMELSLAVHPEPSEERLIEFAIATRGKPLMWNKFTTLNPVDDRSTNRSQLLHKEAVTLARKSLSGDSSRATPPVVSQGTGSTPPSPPSVDPVTTLENFEPVSRTLTVLRPLDSHPGVSVTGNVTLQIRKVETPEERELLLLPRGADPNNPQLPFFFKEGGVEITNIIFLKKDVELAKGVWVDGTVGEISFSSEQEPPAPWEDCRMSARIAVYSLLQSIYKDGQPNQDMILGGDIGPMLKGDMSSNIQASRIAGKPYLLIPDAAYDKLIGYLQSTEDLSALFDPEIVGYKNRQEVAQTLAAPTPEEWRQASESFAEIKSVSARMALTDLARNAKVQERLTEILELMPNHLSARAMLEFGGSASSPATDSTSAADQISTLMEPYFSLREDSPDFNTLKQNFDRTEEALSDVRQNLPLELRRYQAAAEDALEAIEVYLNLSNRSTSTGFQKFREVDEALKVVAAERTKLELAD